jgi:hypothetical protein
MAMGSTYATYPTAYEGINSVQHWDGLLSPAIDAPTSIIIYQQMNIYVTYYSLGERPKKVIQYNS